MGNLALHASQLAQIAWQQSTGAKEYLKDSPNVSSQGNPKHGIKGRNARSHSYYIWILTFQN